MATKQEQISALERLLSKGSIPDDKKKFYEDKLAKLKSGDAAPKKPKGKPSDKDECPEFITEALTSIDEAVASFKQGVRVDDKQIEDVLRKSQFGLANLSPDLKEYLDKTRKIELKAPKQLEFGDALSGKRPIIDVIISDLEANNNVYMYGGAGTGKTYTSKQVAKALNCSLIVINCNQYTSPTELVGGQTIEGFIQGKLIIAWANLKAGDRGVKSGMEEGRDGCLLLLDELPKIDPNTAGILNDALALVKDSGESPAIQDRFAGSTYKLFVDLENELQIMKGYLWIWNFLTPLRFEIQEAGYENQAFVSIRLDQSLRDTWRVWYANAGDPDFVPKSVREGCESFFDLFSEDQAKILKEKSEYDKFLKVIQIKEKKDSYAV